MLLVLIVFCLGFGCLVIDVLVLVVLCLVFSVDVEEKECIIDADGCVVFWFQCWLCCTWFILVLVVLCLVFSLDVGEKECIIDADGGQNHVCCL